MCNPVSQIERVLSTENQKVLLINNGVLFCSSALGLAFSRRIFISREREFPGNFKLTKNIPFLKESQESAIFNFDTIVFDSKV